MTISVLYLTEWYALYPGVASYLCYLLTVPFTHAVIASLACTLNTRFKPL